jgi:hypothetical protein
MITMFMAAKKAYVPQPIVANIGPVTLDVSIPLYLQREGQIYITTKKLNSQFEAVDKALAGALILIGVTSAG